jgi:hypothetical protein
MPPLPSAGPSEDGQSASPPVPAYNRNPLQSLSIQPLILTVRGMDYTIPAASAAGWLELFWATDWSPDDFLMGIDPRLVLDDLVAPEDGEQLLYAVVEELTGRHWWIALRLVAIVREYFHVLGPEMWMSGADPNKLSLAGWLDIMTILIMERVSADQQPMFFSQLEMPPASVGTEALEEELTMTTDQFLSLMSS